jgi:hypothetical protein
VRLRFLFCAVSVWPDPLQINTKIVWVIGHGPMNFWQGKQEDTETTSNHLKMFDLL